MRDLAEVGYLTHERIEEKASLLDQLARTVSHVQVADALDAPSPNLASAAVEFVEPGGGIAARESQALGKRSSTEFKVRARQMFDNVAMQQRAFPEQQLQQELSIQPLPSEQAQAAPTADFAEGTMRSVWIGDELLLIRAVTVGMEQYLQGCWLDWPALSRQMLVSVADLLPDASLVRADLEPDPDDVGRLLAALPVRLETGPIEVGERRVTPIRIALVVAWCCAAFAATTVGLLLRGTLSLSRRRAAFVSAVTHELRTPLTTFRMYTEMLANDMVKGEEKKKRYLETLHSESGRLAHLVENVLSYARLERGRGANALENRVHWRAARTHGGAIDATRRAGKHGTRRDRSAGRAAGDRARQHCSRRADPHESRGQTPATMPTPRRTAGFTSTCATTPRRRPSVFGTTAPASPAPRPKRLFQPFTKSAHEAANSAPGIGLGLALSRRLARDLGGSLRLLPLGRRRVVLNSLCRANNRRCATRPVWCRRHSGVVGNLKRSFAFVK